MSLVQFTTSTLDSGIHCSFSKVDLLGALGGALVAWSLLGLGARSVNHFVDGGLLVSGAGDDVLVVRRDITAENRRRLFGLKQTMGV